MITVGAALGIVSVIGTFFICLLTMQLGKTRQTLFRLDERVVELFEANLSLHTQLEARVKELEDFRNGEV